VIQSLELFLSTLFYNNRIMRKVFFLLLNIFIALSANAQKGKVFEGKVIFDISYPGMELDATTASMLPKETVVFIKNDKQRTDMSMGMGMTNSTIVDGKTKTAIVLMDIMGNKYSMKMTEETIKKQEAEMPEPKVKLLDETKEIAGYKCKKAEMIFEDAQTKDFSYFIYYTPEIGSKDLNWLTSQFKGIEGFLMEFETRQQGMTMKMSAREVVTESVPDSKFVIPADYKETSTEELQKMFGGN